MTIAVDGRILAADGPVAAGGNNLAPDPHARDERAPAAAPRGVCGRAPRPSN